MLIYSLQVTQKQNRIKDINKIKRTLKNQKLMCHILSLCDLKQVLNMIYIYNELLMMIKTLKKI